MKFKIKKLIKIIFRFLESEICKVKVIKVAVAGVLSASLLDFTSWSESLTHALLIALCATDFEDGNES